MTQNQWHTELSIETSASPETVWAIFRDVPGWKRWNAGIEHIEIDGPFAPGACVTMQPPGQEAFRSILVEVRENESFVDETRVGDLVVKVGHRLERLGQRSTRVRYSVEAVGPEADQIGPAISSDFPAVLEALVALAEGKRS